METTNEFDWKPIVVLSLILHGILIEYSFSRLVGEAACVPQMQKGNDVARTVHIGKLY